jgi:hypothetical protein
MRHAGVQPRTRTLDFVLGDPFQDAPSLTEYLSRIGHVQSACPSPERQPASKLRSMPQSFDPDQESPIPDGFNDRPYGPPRLTRGPRGG